MKGRCNTSGENVKAEVEYQTPVITQIAENLGVTITTPSGTNKQILQGNNANLLNIKDNAKKTGAYVWKKLTAEGGDFIDFVVSDSETAYPDGAEQGGYWYELFDLKSFGIDFGEVTLASTAKSVTVSHNLGVVPSWVALVPKEFGVPGSNDVYASNININGMVGYSGSRLLLSSVENILLNNEMTFNCYTTTNNKYTYPFKAIDYYWFAIA